MVFKPKKFGRYKHIVIQPNVREGRPTIIGTDIEPIEVVQLKDKEKAVKRFKLSLEQIEECFKFISA